jgi:glycosyltransferase involved in cell wall biosynthesis
MKVLVAINSLASCQGGPSRSVSGLSDALASQGVDCLHLTVSLPPGEGEVLPVSAARRPPFRIPAIWWGTRPFYWPFQVERVAERLVQAHAPDLVHVHGVWSPSMHRVCVFARKHGLPLMISPRGMLTPWALRHRPWKKWLAYRLYQHWDLAAATVLHATADAEAADLRDLGLRNPLAVIPNAVDLPPWREPVFGRSPRTVLFLSRIHPKKGLLLLVEAWSRLRPAHWRCVIAGPDEGGHLAEVRRAVHHAGLEREFSFPGPVEDKEKWALYQGADLFVLPTYSENFGVVIAEALACGVPVITTRGAPWHELETHQCGWWVETRVAPLAAALQEAMALADAERCDMGRRGRRLVEARYSWDRVGGQMKAVYEWMLRRGPRPDSIVPGGVPCV